MTNAELLTKIAEIGIIPAVSVASGTDALFACETVFSSGIPIAEITMTTPGAAGVIRHLQTANPGVIVGAGTVLDLDTAHSCLDAGASFLTSTGLEPEIVGFARQHKILIIPGALTPTEVMAAKRAGAECVKIFPCASLGGPSYIRALRRPFLGTRLMASGGVTQQTAAKYILAGADVLGIGNDLLPPEAIRTRNSDWINELSRRFLAMVKDARSGKITNSGGS